jgi:outer membrane PBP1 activator LpoA protein
MTRLSLFAALVILTACGPTRPSGPDTGAAETRAASLEATGDYDAAAAEWQSIAAVTSGSARDRAVVAAARNLRAAGRTSDARDMLETLSPPAGATGIEFALLSAQLALESGRPGEATEFLGMLPADVSIGVRTDAMKIRADALWALGRGGAAVETLVEREAMLVSASQAEQNRRLIWNRLQENARSVVDMKPPPGAGPVVEGWLELGRLLQGAGGDVVRLQQPLAAWLRRNPSHPASVTVLGPLLASLGQLTGYPSKVALILPLTGQLSASATAIRDGFLAAHYLSENREDRPEVLIADSGAMGAAAAWEHAAGQGADFIVGPLSKQEVSQLSGVTGGVSTLALNELSGAGALPEFVFQFSLSPEDEAAQAADRILSQGLVRGVAMVPANDWGMRIAASFGEALQADGGRLLEVRTYVPGLPDYSQEITEVLRVNDSRTRHQRVEGIVGESLEFEPRRRQDAEFVFLAALPRDARQIRPQLRFHYAQDLPVFATSSVYTPGDSGNRDLDGIIFDDMPWVLAEDGATTALRNRLNAIWPASVGRRARLYALGYDAYTLVPLIHTSRLGAVSNLQGLTGTLSLTDERRVRRELDWALITDGGLRPLPDTRDE